MRALVDLREPVAAHADPHPPPAPAALQLDVVLPLDLVADVILVAGGRAGVGRREAVQRLARRAERQPVAQVGGHPPVQVRPARVAPVLVAEAAAPAGGGVAHHRRVPAGVEPAVAPDRRVAVVQRPRAGVEAPGPPDSMRLGGPRAAGRPREPRQPARRPAHQHALAAAHPAAVAAVDHTGVPARPAVDPAVAAAVVRAQQVAAAPAVQAIRSATAVDPVGAGAAADHVALPGADQTVGARGGRGEEKHGHCRREGANHRWARIGAAEPGSRLGSRQ